MKKILYTIILLLIVIQTTIFAENRVICSQTVRPMMERIEKVPAAKELMRNILEEGPLFIASIQSDLTDRFGAAWDPDRRTIFVNLSQDFGHVIGSILFEMCNAKANSQFDYIEQLAIQGQIDKNNFVAAMESIEYENSLIAANIAEEGIRLEQFPANARLPTYSSFQEHFYYQQYGGHSAWFAASYDELVKTKL